MDNKLIEETLKKIIDLDEQTERLRKRIEEDTKEREQTFRKELRDLETRYMEGIRNQSRKAYRQTIEEANREKREIIEASIARCHGLEALLSDREDELVKQVFKDLFDVEVG